MAGKWIASRLFSKSKPERYRTFLLTLGILSALISVLLAIFSHHLESSILAVLRHQLLLVPSSQMLDIWKSPPIVPRLKIHLFNVTNHERFLAGVEKLSIEEIGPFTYAAKQEKKVDIFSDDEEEITFKTRTTYNFLPEESVMNDEEAFFVMPNLLLFSGMLKSEVKTQSDFVKQNIIWPILTSAGHKKPFLTLSAREYLFGYEDELACLDTSGDEDFHDQDEMFADEGDWFTFSKRSTVEQTLVSSKMRHGYRQKDGRCIFGALSHVNATWSDEMIMKTGRGNLRDKGKLVSIAGTEKFGIWKPSCDAFVGDQEPSALPPDIRPEESFPVHLGVLCRAVEMVPGVREGEFEDFPNSRRYVPSPDTFMNETCFASEDTMLPTGSMSVRNCCEGTPVAVSFPRFLHGDKW